MKKTTLADLTNMVTETAARVEDRKKIVEYMKSVLDLRILMQKNLLLMVEAELALVRSSRRAFDINQKLTELGEDATLPDTTKREFSDAVSDVERDWKNSIDARKGVEEAISLLRDKLSKENFVDIGEDLIHATVEHLNKVELCDLAKASAFEVEFATFVGRLVDERNLRCA